MAAAVNWPKSGMYTADGKLHVRPQLLGRQVDNCDAMLPTPTRSFGVNARGWGLSKTGRRRYSEQTQQNAWRFGTRPPVGLLEWMMGFPPGWTDVNEKGVETMAQSIAEKLEANRLAEDSQRLEILGYKVHPAAALFPLIQGEEFDELCDSILKHGLRQPIVVDGNVLIDGRNRLRAVEALRAKGEKVELRVAQWVNDGRNVCEWIWDTNALRRHMSEDSLVCASAEIWKLIAKENEARRAAAQFKKGQSGNPSGKKQAESKSSPPARRDTKAKDARSTAGQVAARAKVSLHKAKQAVKLDKAVEAGIVSPVVKQEVISGKRKLSDAAKAIPAKKAKPQASSEAGPRELKDPKSKGYAMQTLRALKRYLESVRLDQERVDKELQRIDLYQHWQVLGFESKDEMLVSHGIAKPFELEDAGHRLRDLLRAELDKWPKENQRKAGYWIRQIIEKEYGLEDKPSPDRIPEKINLLATEFLEAAPERADELCGLLTIWAERITKQTEPQN